MSLSPVRPQPECVFHGVDLLGEVPIWDPRDNRIWWIDVDRAQLHALDVSSGRHDCYQLPRRTVGSWALRASGGVVAALDTGLGAFDPGTGAVTWLAPIMEEDQLGDHRPNDGRCDRHGRFWVGTMNRWGTRAPTGAFYSIGSDLVRTQWLDGIAVPNGICFSPDDAIMYFCDSARKAIWAFDFDIGEGRISNRRVFRDLSNEPGIPDGSAVDAEGFLWNARFGASRVVRYDPKGRVDRSYALPVSKPTSLAFGGADMATLFITTASAKLTPDQLAAEPLAGALFAFEPGPKGLPEPYFAG